MDVSFEPERAFAPQNTSAPAPTNPQKLLPGYAIVSNLQVNEAIGIGRRRPFGAWAFPRSGLSALCFQFAAVFPSGPSANPTNRPTGGQQATRRCLVPGNASVPAV
jgi:hypothetical protein